MGIKLLNSFIKNKCGIRGPIDDRLKIKSNRIKCLPISIISFKHLRNKSISIDISIYMYRFIEERKLEENMHKLCNLFVTYNINPIFVFDGKPPKEKWDEIIKRDEYKKQIEKEYNKLLTSGETNVEIIRKMEELRKQMIRVTKEHIVTTKSIIDSYGFNRITAKREAEELCVEYVYKKHSYACVTDDMDVFAYNCSRVLREMDIHNETFVLYNFRQICKKINIDPHNFRILCCISGNDYESGINNIYKNFELLIKYKKQKDKNFKIVKFKEEYKNIYKYGLLHYLLIHNYINVDRLKTFVKLYNMYDLTNKDVLGEHSK